MYSYCFVSGKRRTLVDSFLALKDTNDEGAHTYQQSASAQSAKLSLEDGVFRCDNFLFLRPSYNKILPIFILRLEVDLHEFGPEDIDISVEGKWA